MDFYVRKFFKPFVLMKNQQNFEITTILIDV